MSNHKCGTCGQEQQDPRHHLFVGPSGGQDVLCEVCGVRYGAHFTLLCTFTPAHQPPTDEPIDDGRDLWGDGDCYCGTFRLTRPTFAYISAGEGRVHFIHTKLWCPDDPVHKLKADHKRLLDENAELREKVERYERVMRSVVRRLGPVQKDWDDTRLLSELAARDLRRALVETEKK